MTKITIDYIPLLLGFLFFWISSEDIRFPIVIYISIVIHEFGHYCYAVLNKYRVKEVIFSGIYAGVDIDKDDLKERPSAQLYFWGPMFNLMFACFLYIQIHFTFNKSAIEFLSLNMFMNIIIAIFNLFPALPLDGGKIWEIFCNKFKSLHEYGIFYSIQIISCMSIVYIDIFSGIFITVICILSNKAKSL